LQRKGEASRRTQSARRRGCVGHLRRRRQRCSCFPVLERHAQSGVGCGLSRALQCSGNSQRRGFAVAEQLANMR
jgi:hypothetical protein